jgi:hypothetical protein
VSWRGKKKALEPQQQLLNVRACHDVMPGPSSPPRVSCRHAQKLQTALTPVQLGSERQKEAAGHTAAGLELAVRFGDVLQLVHAHSGVVLAVDVNDKVRSQHEPSHSCSGSPALVSSLELA